MLQSKRILFISGIQIFPPESGGQLRSAGLCQSLADMGHFVDIFSLTGRKDDYLKCRSSSYQQISSQLGEYVCRFPVFGIIQWFFYKFRLPPLWLFLFSFPFFMLKELRKKLEEAEIVIVDFPFLHGLKKFAKGDFIVNTHNAEYELYRDNRLLLKLVKKVECLSFIKADHILFCHEGDLNKFSFCGDHVRHKSWIIPNGVDQTRFKHNDEDRIRIRRKLNIRDEEVVFLFTGSQYRPNQDAFLFIDSFCETNKGILKKLKVKFLVVGTVCLKEKETSVLRVCGRVNDINPYFFASDFLVNPVIDGSGVNVKMLEAMAAKLPILSTSFGQRGLALVDMISVVIVERYQFIDGLHRALALTTKEKASMAERALENNLDKIDMKISLKKMPLFYK